MEVQIKVFEGVQYVTKSEFDAVFAKYQHLKDLCQSIFEQLSEEGIGLRRVRRRGGQHPSQQQQDVLDALWTLFRITGPGYSSMSGAGMVQMYRIDCGSDMEQEQQEQDAQQELQQPSGSSSRFLFRPRCALELLATSEVWQATAVDKVAKEVTIALQPSQ